jgi:hypothetical protein
MPTSEKQIAANQANAQKSTGPTSPEGKSRSRMNGMRHNLTGQAFLMTEEDRIAYDAFSKPYIEALQPANPIETQLAQVLAQENHRLNRIHAIEENTFALGHFGRPGAKIDAEHPEVHHALTQAVVFATEGKTFQNLSLYEQRLTRSIHKNMQLLLELQDRRKAEERARALESRESKPKTRAAAAAYTENGFGFSTQQFPVPIDRKTTLETPETPPREIKNVA